jgi:hypothetical protein
LDGKKGKQFARGRGAAAIEEIVWGLNHEGSLKNHFWKDDSKCVWRGAKHGPRGAGAPQRLLGIRQKLFQDFQITAVGLAYPLGKSFLQSNCERLGEFVANSLVFCVTCYSERGCYIDFSNQICVMKLFNQIKNPTVLGLVLALSVVPAIGFAQSSATYSTTPAPTTATPAPPPMAFSANNSGRLSAPAQEVVKLVDSGVSPSVINAYVESSPSTFNLTSDDLINLHKQGVPNDTLTEILRHDKAMHDQAVLTSSQYPNYPQPMTAPPPDATDTSVPQIAPQPQPDYSYTQPDYSSSYYGDYGYPYYGYGYGYPYYGYYPFGYIGGGYYWSGHGWYRGGRGYGGRGYGYGGGRGYYGGGFHGNVGGGFHSSVAVHGGGGFSGGHAGGGFSGGGHAGGGGGGGHR